MKARITVQICDLCRSYTQDAHAEGGVEIPVLIIHYGTGGDSLKDVLICDTCTRDEPLSLLKLYQQIDQTRTENQS